MSRACPLLGFLPALLLLVALADPSSAAVEPDSSVVIAIDDHVSVPVPADMSREQRSLGVRGDMLTLADGNDVVVVVVYRRDGADKPPTSGEALRVHVEELDRTFGPATRLPSKRRVLGRDQSAMSLALSRDGVERDAWVVAFEARGMTIVVSSVMVRGSPNEAVLVSVLKGIRVQ